jgi:hypothetical protein
MVPRLRDRSDDSCGDAAFYVEAYGCNGRLGAGEPLVDGFASRQSRKADLGRGQLCRISRVLLSFHPLISKAFDIGQKPSAD